MSISIKDQDTTTQGAPQQHRTLFLAYVPWGWVEAAVEMGWIVTSDHGGQAPHDLYGIIMEWLCDCRAPMPWVRR